MSNSMEAVAARFIKKAETPPPLEQGLSNELASKGRSDILNMAIASLGVGAAGRGLVGLFNTARRNLNPPHASYPGSVIAKIPYPLDATDDDEQAPALSKAALFGIDIGEPSTKDGQGWYYPGMAIAGGVGAIGGWKLMDSLLEKRRQSEQEEELNSAKSDFERSLAKSYRRPLKPKLAGDAATQTRDPAAELGEALDRLYDLAQSKQANVADTLGSLGGSYLGFYALPTAALAGWAAYDRTSKGSSRAILEKAMQRRIRRAYGARPAEIYAVPDPIKARRVRAPEPEAEDAAADPYAEAVAPYLRRKVPA